MTGPPSKAPLAPLIQPFIDRHAVAGAVILVGNRERVLDLEAVGYSDFAAGKPIRTDDLFWIASQSKPITATAFMMLVDAGMIRLDDPVEKYLPEFTGQWLAVERDDEHILLSKPSHPIRVCEILSHTSGLPFASAMERPTLDRLPLWIGARGCAMTPLDFEPGTQYAYSNAGINTAGRIIEVVSGMPFETFLDERLLRPLGMSDTTFWPSAGQLQRLVNSYKPNEAGTDLEATVITQLTYPLDDRSRQPMPAGGLFSTAPDLARFCMMVLNGGRCGGTRLLSDDAVHEMTRRHTDDDMEASYGLGWATDGVTFGHGGAYATNMTVDTRSGLITIFLVQHAGFPLDGDQCQSEFRSAAEAEYVQEAGPTRR